MTVELSRKHSLYQLLIDELAYRIVRRVNNRARARQESSTPLFAPTTDLIGHRLISTGVFERTQIEALDALLEGKCALADRFTNELDMFVDVGANIGFYTTRYAQKFKRVLAIEANPITFDVLKSNIVLSQTPNVTAVCVGASDERGSLRLRIPGDGVMGWASFENVEATDRAIDVQVRTIDDLTEEIAPTAAVSVMKIDVEGHEARVLRGTEAVLNRHKPVVLYEQLNSRAGAECVRILRAAGYTDFLAFTRKANPWLPFSKCPVNAHVVDPSEVDRCALICAC